MTSVQVLVESFDHPLNSTARAALPLEHGEDFSVQVSAYLSNEGFGHLHLAAGKVVVETRFAQAGGASNLGDGGAFETPVSKMLTGNDSPNIVLRSYRDEAEAQVVVEAFLADLADV